MSLAFIDSVAHYSTAEIGSKYTDENSTVVVPYGRSGSQSLSMPDSDSYVSITLPAQSGFVCGVGIKWTTGGVCGASFSAAELGEAALIGVCAFTVNADGSLSIGSETTTPNIFTSGKWSYVEMLVTFGEGSVGGNPVVSYSATLRVQGVEQLTSSGNSGLNPNSTLFQFAGCNVFQLFNSGGTASNFADIYCNNLLGDLNNTWEGVIINGRFSCGVFCLFPIADSVSEFTPSTGSTHFNLINGHVPLYDASYVESSGLNQIDSYFLPTPSVLIGEIQGAQVVQFQRKTTSNYRGFTPYVEGAVIGDQAYLSNTYIYDLTPLDTFAGDVPFTRENIASTTWGLKNTL